MKKKLEKEKKEEIKESSIENSSANLEENEMTKAVQRYIG